MSNSVAKRVSASGETHFGKPIVTGTRIPVQDVLELVRVGITFEQITKEYFPDLSHDDIRACVQYAIDIVTLEDIHLAASET